MGDFTVTGGSENSFGIGGDYAYISTCTGLKATGGSVKSTFTVTPTDESGNPVYPMIIPNPNGADVYIDGVKYSASANRSVYDSDTNLYVYLTGADHAVTVDGNTKIYAFENSAFEEMNVYFAPEFGIIPTEDGMTWDGDTKMLTLDNATVSTYSKTDDIEKVDIALWKR